MLIWMIKDGFRKTIDYDNIMFINICKAMGMECIAEYRFHPIRRWRNDFFFPEVNLAVEIEGKVWGGRHTRPLGFIKDIEKYNALTEAGIYLLRYQPKKIDYNQILNVYNYLLKKKRESNVR